MSTKIYRGTRFRSAPRCAAKPCRVGHVVGSSIRSDGGWIWYDVHLYYLRTYSCGIDPDFLAHIRACAYEPRRPDRQESAAILDELVQS